MPFTISKCELFRIKHITFFEGETFLRNKHEIAFFEIKCTFFGRKENTIKYLIGHYNPSVRIIDLVSHTTYVVCVNFIHKCRDLQFKVDYERQIFWETFHGNFYLLSKFLSEICWEEIAEEILFVFRFDVWPGTRTLAFRLISQHTT